MLSADCVLICWCMFSDVHVPKPEPPDGCLQWGHQSYDLQPLSFPGGHPTYHTPLHTHPPLDHTLPAGVGGRGGQYGGLGDGSAGGGAGGIVSSSSHGGVQQHDGEHRIWQQLR